MRLDSTSFIKSFLEEGLTHSDRNLPATCGPEVRRDHIAHHTLPSTIAESLQAGLQSEHPKHLQRLRTSSSANPDDTRGGMRRQWRLQPRLDHFPLPDICLVK